MINREKILQLADLCKLDVEKEVEIYREEISNLLETFQKMEKVDTNQVEATFQINKEKNPLREDKIGESLSQEEVLKNTVEEQYGFFKILKVMD